MNEEKNDELGLVGIDDTVACDAGGRRNSSTTAAGADAGDGSHDVLKLDEAAALLRISPRTLQRLVQRGGVPHHHFGRSLRFSRDRLMAVLDDTTPSPTRRRPNAPKPRRRSESGTETSQNTTWYNDLGTTAS